MDQQQQRIFNDKDEEINYWKTLAEQYREAVEKIQKESDEFVNYSQQLEKEYEASIEQNEKKIKDLTLANNRLHNEAEAIRFKLDQNNKLNNKLENEIEKLQEEIREKAQYVREIEQKNDDLERQFRIVQESVAGIETAFHNAIERNAILESEVDEKESLKEKLQRLADETRDLKQELLVKEKIQDERLVNGYCNNKTATTTTTTIIDSNKLKESETQTSPLKNDISYQAPISPASRVMALNIVSDLIRKVGNLERRLEKSRYDCRDLSTSDLRSRHSTKNSPTASIQGLTK